MKRLRSIELPDTFKRPYVGAAFFALGLFVFVSAALGHEAATATIAGVAAVIGFTVALWRNRDTRPGT